jgi:hypothetical protein
MLVTVMPWQGLSHLTKPDALAIAAFLKSVPPVKNKVPGPFGPDDKPSVFVMSVLPGDVYAGLPKPR